MERARTVACSALVGWASVALWAHDLFLKPASFFLEPASSALVQVLNGTFSRSESAVARDRLADLSLEDGGGRRALDLSAWSETDPRSHVAFRTAQAGTYVLGAAVKPRVLPLPGAEFNKYLEEEGLDAVLARRREQGRLDAGSRERYSKYAKTILQVGQARTVTWAVSFGYPAEIVPLDNPYALAPGATLRLRCLVDGAPAAGLAVFAGGRKAHSDSRIAQQRVTSGSDGVVEVKLTDVGAWYVKFIHMRELEEPEANYESRWATLTFAIAHGAAAPR